jgi:hypothetical protein
VQKYLSDFSDASLRELKASRATKLIVISRNHAATLDRIRLVFRELAGWRPDLAGDLTHATMVADKTQLIVVNLISGTRDSQLRAPLPALP